LSLPNYELKANNIVVMESFSPVGENLMKINSILRRLSFLFRAKVIDLLPGILDQGTNLHCFP
jgi:hypothetical protein